MKEQIKILVCCHKKSNWKTDDIHMPIHVGANNSQVHLDIQRDDDGDNISDKNPNYCELTGLYWGWKNLKHYNIIGICHYRRYFNISKDEINYIINTQKYDFIVSKHRNRPYNIANEIINQLTKEDFVILESVLKKKHPKDVKTIEKYFYICNSYNPYNMLICNNDVLNKYCNWLFGLLEELEKYIKLSGYSRLRRIYGYFGEYLLTLYIQMNNLKAYEVETINTEEQQSRFKQNLLNIYNSAKFHFLQTKKHSQFLDVKKGLENDHIII